MDMSSRIYAEKSLRPTVRSVEVWWAAHLPAIVLDDDRQRDAGIGRSKVGDPAQETLAGTHRLWAHLVRHAHSYTL